MLTRRRRAGVHRALLSKLAASLRRGRLSWRQWHSSQRATASTNELQCRSDQKKTTLTEKEIMTLTCIQDHSSSESELSDMSELSSCCARASCCCSWRDSWISSSRCFLAAAFAARASAGVGWFSEA